MSERAERVDETQSKNLDEGTKSTRGLMVQTFLQTVKSYRVQDSGQAVLAELLGRFQQDMERYFNEYDSFSLQVDQHRLFYRGKVVYESEDAADNLASLFFKDGIREIRFYKGIEDREIADFLKIMRKSDRLDRMEDDLVTLFWQGEFFHVAITTADDFLEWGGKFIPATAEELERGVKYGEGEGEDESPEKADPSDSEKSYASLAEDWQQALNGFSSQSLVQAFQIAPHEAIEINGEIESEHQPGYFLVLMDSLIEILLHLGEEREAYENMIGYFERTVEFLLERNEVEQAVSILKSLHEAKALVTEERQQAAIRRILETTSGTHYIEILGKTMKGNGEVDSEPVLQYLRFLTQQAVDPLCRLLVELQPGKWKKIVSDFLAELSRDDIRPLTRYLSDSNPIMVCHVLAILGKVSHPSTVNHLSNLVTHDDPRVREVILQILIPLGKEGGGLLQKFLGDKTPEIRSKASLLFARLAKDQAVMPLTHILFSDGFHKRDYEEKAAFVRALGETGAKEAIPVLKKIAKKRLSLTGFRWNEMRPCAMSTLKMMEADKGLKA